jgi:hypothetical protein
MATAYDGLNLSAFAPNLLISYFYVTLHNCIVIRIFPDFCAWRSGGLFLKIPNKPLNKGVFEQNESVDKEYVICV